MEEVSLILRNEWAGYRRLCAAMILRASADLGLCVYHVVPGQSTREEHKSAYQWIYGKADPLSLTFVTCCEVLDIDPTWLRETIKPMIIPVGTCLRPDRRDAPLYSLNGQTRSLRNWSKLYGVCFDVLRYRLKRGWSLADALNRPVGLQGPRRKAA